jgi:hypothetical protein
MHSQKAEDAEHRMSHMEADFILRKFNDSIANSEPERTDNYLVARPGRSANWLVAAVGRIAKAVRRGNEFGAELVDAEGRAV